MNNKNRPLKHQTGVVLVISLIMLVLLTLIGITGTQVTSLEEKMASNTRDQNLAFQAAESALREGETYLSPASNNFVIIDAVFNNGPHHLFAKADATTPPFTDNIRASNETKEFDTGDSKINTQPRYFIKHTATKVANTGANINIGGGYGGAAAALDVDYFIVTARGTGAQDSSQIFLQSYYAIKLGQ